MLRTRHRSMTETPDDAEPDMIRAAQKVKTSLTMSLSDTDVVGTGTRVENEHVHLTQTLDVTKEMEASLRRLRRICKCTGRTGRMRRWGKKGRGGSVWWFECESWQGRDFGTGRDRAGSGYVRRDGGLHDEVRRASPSGFIHVFSMD